MNPDDKNVDLTSDVECNEENKIDEKLENYTDEDLVIKAVDEGNLSELKKVLHGKRKKDIQRLANIEIIWNIDLVQLYVIPLYLYKIEMSSTLKPLRNKQLLDSEDQRGKTRNLLSIACFNEHYEIAQYLIENCRVDVNKSGTDGFPPLWYAICKDNIEIVVLLLRHGAKATADTAYTTALHFACYCGNLDIVNLLIKYGKDIPLLDTFDKTPVIAAAKHQQVKIVERLLEMPKLHMPNDKINAYQLMGALSSRNENMAEALKFWKLAFNAKKKLNNREVKKKINNSSSSNISTQNYVKEIDSLRTIDKLKNDHDQIDRQQILIFHKILGPLHSYTNTSIMECAEDYIQTLQVDKYIELWNYVTDLQQSVPAELHRHEMLFSIGKYMDIAVDYLKFMSYCELVKMFEKAVKEVERLYQIMEKFPDDRNKSDVLGKIILEEFECILCYTLRIAVLITSKKSEKNDKLWKKFIKAVCDFVHINPKAIQGRSIMHLSHCKYYDDKSSDYIQYYDKYCRDIETTSLELTKVLLQAGANPNELDENLSTPLHYAAVSFRNDTDFAELLLQNGAHLDYKNAAGLTYEILLNNKLLFNSLLPFNKLTLMCLAAHVINKINVKEYYEMVPKHLIDFVHRHY